MKIKSIILNVLFIIILICLIYFFIYLNNSNFENFIDKIDNPLASSSEEISFQPTTTIENTPESGLTEYQPPEIILENDGRNGNDRALPNVNYAFVLEEASKNKKGGKTIEPYKDGYYWINIPTVGSRYIYCIYDKKFFGGGWMLAMRSVYGSKEFSYNSKYYTEPNFLNNTSSEIENLVFKTEVVNGINTKTPTVDLNISSIGDLIYKIDGIDPKKYDAKFDVFNHSIASEWMAIFYVINPDNGKKIIGGDILPENGNSRGWVWYEPNVKNEKDQSVTPLEFFQVLDKQNISKNIAKKYNNLGFAQNIRGKFYNDFRNAERKYYNQIFSSQPITAGITQVTSFYGFNYNKAQPDSAVRWGFNFNDTRDGTNDAFAGIGTAYSGLSAGNFEMPNTENSKFLDRPISDKLRNRSYAVEWYIREKKCNS